MHRFMDFGPNIESRHPMCAPWAALTLQTGNLARRESGRQHRSAAYGTYLKGQSVFSLITGIFTPSY